MIFRLLPHSGKALGGPLAPSSIGNGSRWAPLFSSHWETALGAPLPFCSTGKRHPVIPIGSCLALARAIWRAPGDFLSKGSSARNAQRLSVKGRVGRSLLARREPGNLHPCTSLPPRLLPHSGARPSVIFRPLLHSGTALGDSLAPSSTGNGSRWAPRLSTHHWETALGDRSRCLPSFAGGPR